MIEIQCTSCHTRYRIDERVLPDDTPTFKCSRCGHVFNADPVPAQSAQARAAASGGERIAAGAHDPPRAAAPERAQVAGRKRRRQTRAGAAEPQPAIRPSRKRRVPSIRSRSCARRKTVDARGRPQAAQPRSPKSEPARRPAANRTSDDPLDRPSATASTKADTGENLRFDFSDERNEVGRRAAGARARTARARRRRMAGRRARRPSSKRGQRAGRRP